mmetsp:Transcript_63626/g.112983  ORF Transcript_63626/g.112983 Transcript_63626/m.112983 type:complete len:241 (+) Transcript_63626:373-1095(+)
MWHDGIGTLLMLVRICHVERPSTDAHTVAFVLALLAPRRLLRLAREISWKRFDANLMDASRLLAACAIIHPRSPRVVTDLALLKRGAEQIDFDSGTFTRSFSFRFRQLCFENLFRHFIICQLKAIACIAPSTTTAKIDEGMRLWLFFSTLKIRHQFGSGICPCSAIPADALFTEPRLGNTHTWAIQPSEEQHLGRRFAHEPCKNFCFVGKLVLTRLACLHAKVLVQITCIDLVSSSKAIP